MKFLILGSIFSLVTYIGFKFGNRYKEKVDFYNDFSIFLLYLKSQISFLKVDLITIFNQYECKNNHFKNLICNLSDDFNSYRNINVEILKEDENLQIRRFFEGLGKNDCLTEEDYIKRQIEIFNKKLNDAKDLNLKYGNMYKKLSILLGIFVCIVLI